MKFRYFLIFILILIFIIGCAVEIKEEKIDIGEEKNYEVVNMKLTSSAFENEGDIPSEFTCDGADISPPLTISEVPEKTKTLALICDDPDAPMGTFVHWVVWNIPSDTKEIAKGTEPQGMQGKTDFGKQGYGGPCPPSGTHRYFFKIYALDTEINFEESSTKKDLEKAMEGHILAEAQLMGNYQRR